MVRADPAGDPRSVRIGFSTLPPDRTTAAYTEAFATAAQYGDLLVIQRTPPWEEFMPDGEVSTATEQETRFERALLDQYDGLQRFFAIDPTDSALQRSRVARLPAGVDPQEGFKDPDLRQAFVAYVKYVISNYEPDYLALGPEINMLAERNPAQFDAFVSLYHEAYVVAKAASPKTLVFPTFQLEDLLGRFGTAHPARWEVLDAFRGQMDLLAISSYPFLGEVRTAAELPADYYAQVKDHWTGAVMVSETGYPSAPVEGAATVGTEDDQRDFLARVLDDAEAQGFVAVVWLAARDPVTAGQGGGAVFRDIGLRHADGSNKAAWTLWEEWARRPLE